MNDHLVDYVNVTPSNLVDSVNADSQTSHPLSDRRREAQGAGRGDDERVAESLRETEPENWWYRGIHEGGHAAAIWTLDATVTRIEARRVHFDELSARQRAIVAKAGVAAEKLFENPDIRGCQDDERQFTEAIQEIRATEGERVAHQASMDATDEATRIVRDQRAAIEAMAEPIAGLVHGTGAHGTADLSGSAAEAIVRSHWSGALPRALAVD